MIAVTSAPRTATVERLALAVQLPGFAGTTLDDDVADLLRDGLGGICLFGSNTAQGLESLRRLVAAVRELAPDALVAIDEEGGDVTRVHADQGSPVVGAAVLGAAADLDLTRATAGIIGAELAALGIDLALAPVADVNSDPDNPVIGVRSFGAEPQAVATQVGAWVTGLQGAGVAACAKHFPGHGHTGEDSHLALPTVNADLSTLLLRELPPFRSAVLAGVAAVMTSHLRVPALDEEVATFSAPILRLLRDQLGFDGLIVSDALDMAGASGGGRGIPAAAVLALNAGVDLLCLGADKEPALVREVQAAVVAAVADGTLPLTRLREAAERVQRLRTWTAERRPAAPVPAARPGLLPDQIAGAEAALRVDGDLPRLDGALSVRVDAPANIAVGDVPWGLPADVVVGADDAADAAALPGAGAVLLQVREARHRPVVARLLADLSRLSRDVVVVEWGWPDPEPPAVARVCAWGASLPSQEAVRRLLATVGWLR